MARHRWGKRVNVVVSTGLPNPRRQRFGVPRFRPRIARGTINIRLNQRSR